MPGQPPAPHDASKAAWVAYLRGCLVKTLIDQLGDEPNPANSARQVLNDIMRDGDSSTEAVIVAALNASESLTPPP